ncbi:hypothetical protein B0H14DRAFT_2640972 [Mycena olivaceomarginata]|nr:hypothetical protein B0H14DRAFT_2640972 [Mycena olivaceomarginata]
MAPGLFEPVEIGTVALQHRVVLAPANALQGQRGAYPRISPSWRNYYAQRATRPGTLFITESMLIAPRAGGQPSRASKRAGHMEPGADRRLERGVDAAVRGGGGGTREGLLHLHVAVGTGARRGAHAAGCHGATPDLPVRRIRVGRAADGQKCASARAQRGRNRGVRRNICPGGRGTPSQRGFDAWKYTDISNTRTDTYGGSIANRARFVLEVVDAVVAAVGPEHTAIRLSPWSTVHGPLPTSSYLVSALAARHPTLAYLHFIEPRVNGDELRADGTVGAHESNDALRTIWAPRPLIRAGGFDRASALAAAIFLLAPGCFLRLAREIVLDSHPHWDIRLIRLEFTNTGEYKPPQSLKE